MWRIQDKLDETLVVRRGGADAALADDAEDDGGEDELDSASSAGEGAD